jgi:hypothetical protein
MQTESLPDSVPDILQSRASGILFFASFGALWLSLSLSFLHRLDLAAIALLAAGWFSLVLPSVWMLRRVGERAPPRQPDDDERARQRMFRIVNLVQWTAVGVAVVGLQWAGYPLYVVPAIAAIIGLHLFPLAYLFRYSLHYLTGAVLVAWAIAAPLRTAPAEIAGVTGLGTGAILWCSAALTLLYSIFLLTTRLEQAPHR